MHRCSQALGARNSSISISLFLPRPCILGGVISTRVFVASLLASITRGHAQPPPTRVATLGAQSIPHRILRSATRSISGPETKDRKATIPPLVTTRLRILISCNLLKKIWREMCNRTMDEDLGAKVPSGLACTVAVRLPPRSLMLGSPCDAPTALSAYCTVTAWGVVAVRRQT